MNRWSWLLVAFGCVALLLSLHDWRSIATQPPEQPPAAGEPDLYMENATITQYADDGAVRYRLASAEVRHYEEEGLTRLVTPALTLNRAPQPPWFARAERGFVRDTESAGSRAAEVILLRDDVHLVQREPDPVEITCATLRIYPERQFAETDQPVIIQTANGRSTAAGMSGDLRTGLLKLSSTSTARVHTIVLPAQFKRTIARPPE